MSSLYRNRDIQFRYPEGWKLEEIHSEEGLTLSLQSPGSMFLLLTLYDLDYSSQLVADQALAAMREEYPTLDSEPVTETIANLPAIGHDVNFFALDLTNTCWIRAFSTPDRTVLIFAQTNDLDLEADEAVFEALCASTEVPGSQWA